MKHFRLKFNYGVEIGAYLAYIGHTKRTGSMLIQAIAIDELIHRGQIEKILAKYGEKPHKGINRFFFVVGRVIQFLCKFAPRWSLNYVARTMEMFAVYSYRELAKEYPEHQGTFIAMAETEEDHQRFFELGE